MLDIRGDGMNCVWSAPQADMTVRLRACLAALEILEAVDRFNRQHTDRQFPTRVGLHTGWVSLVNVGGGGHFAYSVVGDIMNSASRIQGLNKKLHTWLLASEPVVEDLDDLLVRHIGSFILKGKEEVLSIMEILGPRETATEAACELCEMFAAALTAFAASDWSEAAKMFEAVLSIYPEDGPAQFYIDQRQRNRVNRPSRKKRSAIWIESK